jgi:rhamnopyranosyl-N-acetylglucosaminyl-diphospho-decaprenol beta-1,3/1,4-galactofuranosyltransferase
MEEENKKETVSAVVVTYNRKELLKECLDALLNQTYPLDSIILVDNASTDGTEEFLKEHGYLKNSKIDYVRLSENTGGAGGFYEGMKRGYEKGYDWLWLMDDDGYAPKNCLEIILQDAKKNNLKAINPLVVDKEDNTKLSFGLAGNMMKTDETIKKADNNGLIYGKANPFNGTFLHKDIIVKCGFVKKEMFIWGDETEYFLRIKKNGFEYATTCNIKYFHPESKTVIQSALFGLLNILIKPEKLEMNYYRNIGYINRQYEKNLNIKFLIKYFIFFTLKGQLSKFVELLRYFFDGRNDTYKLPNFK